MKFTITPWDMNQLMKFAKHYIASDTVRPSFSLIQCEVNNTRIKAYCMGRCRICEVRFPVEEFEGKAGICFLPPLPKCFLLKDGNINVRIEKNEVTYQNEVFSKTFKAEQAQGIFPVKETFPAREIWGTSSSKIHFQPKQLLEALQPFANRNEPIRIDFVEEEGFLITQIDGDCSYKVLAFAVEISK